MPTEAWIFDRQRHLFVRTGGQRASRLIIGIAAGYLRLPLRRWQAIVQSRFDSWPLRTISTEQVACDATASDTDPSHILLRP
jgi:hypothetical protein